MAGGTLATRDLKEETIVDIKQKCPRSTSQGHTKRSHLSAPGHHRCEDLPQTQGLLWEGAATLQKRLGARPACQPQYVPGGTGGRMDSALPRDSVSGQRQANLPGSSAFGEVPCCLLL